MCLVFVLDTNTGQRRVLLGLKHSGIGATNVVGLGGHVDPGETAREAAVREAEEEAGIALPPDALNEVGVVRFRFPAKQSWNQDVAVFTTTTWTGEPEPSDEITPAWYDIDAIPFDDMWDDAHHWLPAVLRGESIDSTVTFASDNRTVDAVA